MLPSRRSGLEVTSLRFENQGTSGQFDDDEVSRSHFIEVIRRDQFSHVVARRAARAFDNASPRVIAAHIYSSDRLCFVEELASAADYAIAGQITESALDELISAGKFEELADLIRNMDESI